RGAGEARGRDGAAQSGALPGGTAGRRLLRGPHRPGRAHRRLRARGRACRRGGREQVGPGAPGHGAQGGGHRPAARTAALPRLCAGVLHLGDPGRRHSRAVRGRGPGGGRGPASLHADAGRRGDQAGGGSAAGVGARGAAHGPVGRAGQRRAPDLRVEGQPARGGPLLLPALSRPLPAPGLWLRGLADPAVAAPRDGAQAAPQVAPEGPALKRGRRPDRRGLIALGALLLLLGVGAAVLLSSPKHRIFYSGLTDTPGPRAASATPSSTPTTDTPALGTRARGPGGQVMLVRIPTADEAGRVRVPVADFVPPR